MFNLAPVPVPDLSGKVILVTGAGRGIGHALTELLVERGATVYAGHVDGDVAPSGAHGIGLDVTDQTQVDAAMLRIGEEAGRLDALVNNAGVISPIGPLRELDTDALRPAFEVNVLGVHRMTVAALPLLEKAKGVVVNAGTGAASTPMEGWTAYCSSKAGARMLSLMTAMELKETGVQVFFIGIPPTDTAMQGAIRAAGLNPISKIPQGDLVHPMVPASVMAWLCGPEARELDEVLLDVRDAFFKGMMALD
ncbi:SDR family NAD(P)-dependent oxidoreductase [Histidinibacterium lentulum]|uniref:SDR family NAD(P)-dependent oxidoreductase n=1 Tax=Histidinibacterium lentulum TaxID=2480588 RepID=A0A3N2QMM3_9RHOB|nr:SDR family NAD(P)-dependent oxidoreductase [Histidinibacterium lentulum]ROT96325.1 SDR family NAD(P)-dependent oxidoreductase [Histidinibacterium lentulum]